jgi:hypothetical protein
MHGQPSHGRRDELLAPWSGKLRRDPLPRPGRTTGSRLQHPCRKRPLTRPRRVGTTGAGAGAEIRTRTPLRAAEFKSAASAVPPLRRVARVAEERWEERAVERAATGHGGQLVPGEGGLRPRIDLMVDPSRWDLPHHRRTRLRGRLPLAGRHGRSSGRCCRPAGRRLRPGTAVRSGPPRRRPCGPRCYSP